jgi:hypothetical protein
MGKRIKNVWTQLQGRIIIAWSLPRDLKPSKPLILARKLSARKILSASMQPLFTFNIFIFDRGHPADWHSA